MSDATLKSSTVTARKSYLCDWCGEPIHKGMSYSYYVGVFMGDFQTSRNHLECQAAMRGLSDEELGIK